MHFLKRLTQVHQPLPPGALLFTMDMDVKGLYPIVPGAEAQQACKQALDKRLKPVVPLTIKILETIDVVLENNSFKFGDQNYTQREGTAIGSKLGMHYASTYMGKWESTLLGRVERNHCSTIDCGQHFWYLDTWGAVAGWILWGGKQNSSQNTGDKGVLQR